MCNKGNPGPYSVGQVSGGSNNVLLRGGQSGGVLNACSEILQRTGEMTDISDITLYTRCKDSLSKQ